MTKATAQPQAEPEAIEPDPFDDPASGSFIGKELINELEGALMVFMPKQYREHFPTQFTKPGEQSPAVQADVYVLDGEHKGESFEGAWFWQVMLIAALEPKVGKVIPGRLGKGKGKPGQSPPWTVVKVEGEDRAKAATWYKAWKARQDRDPFAD